MGLKCGTIAFVVGLGVGDGVVLGVVEGSTVVSGSSLLVSLMSGVSPQYVVLKQ